MKLNTQLKLLSATEARCRELESENKMLRNYIREENHGHIVYVPFPEKKGLLRLIGNWFKVRPLETMTLVRSYLIEFDGNKRCCANCMEVFGPCADEFVFCPMCAAALGFKFENEGEKNDQL